MSNASARTHSIRIVERATGAQVSWHGRLTAADVAAYRGTFADAVSVAWGCPLVDVVVD